MKKLFKYIKPHIIFFILAPIFMLVEVGGEVMLPKLISMIINDGVAAEDAGYILQIGFVMVGFAVMMMSGGVLGGYCATKAAVSFSADLRLDVFKKLQSYSFEDIDDFSTGSLVTRLTNDIVQVQNCTRMMLVMMLRSPGMLIGALIMASSINVKLAAIIACVIPVLVVSVTLILKTAFPRFGIMQKKLDNLNSTIQENITNVRVIKSFLRRDFEIKKFSIANDELMDSTLRAMGIVILNMPVSTLIMNLTTIAIVWVGGNFVIAGTMPIGDLTAFTSYIVQILMSLMMLSMIFLQFSRAAASLKRINEILNHNVTLNDNNSMNIDKKVESGSIIFENVFFRYNGNSDQDILTDINLSIPSGATVGIIGMTGSGKTSLVQLIPRLYDVTSGRVLVDGTDVRDYSIKNLRNDVSMVLQNNVLFSGTVKENLKWGNENASDEEIKIACDAAQATSFISSLPNGFNAELEQGGINLSGGQKQRMCIARALLKKPKILILDDSTSAVDSATEARIRESLKTTLKETTKIIIAQRIQSVIDADTIIVMDEGHITGIGTHKELLNSNDVYREIYYSQMDKEVSA